MAKYLLHRTACFRSIREPESDRFTVSSATNFYCETAALTRVVYQIYRICFDGNYSEFFGFEIASPSTWESRGAGRRRLRPGSRLFGARGCRPQVVEKGVWKNGRGNKTLRMCSARSSDIFINTLLRHEAGIFVNRQTEGSD